MFLCLKSGSGQLTFSECGESTSFASSARTSVSFAVVGVAVVDVVSGPSGACTITEREWSWFFWSHCDSLTHLWFVYF